MMIWHCQGKLNARANHRPCSVGGPKQPSLSRRPTTGLLTWLEKSWKASIDGPVPCELSYLGEDKGWGLVASENIVAGEEILSVPIPMSLQGTEEVDLPWSIQMVESLLLELYKEEKSEIFEWMCSLPAHVSIPWLYWENDSITALEEPNIVCEIKEMQKVREYGLEMLSDTYHHDDILWALAMVHSRSFICDIAGNTMHVWVPGIDMCNHNFHKANAHVRIEHSPGASQGNIAESDIAPWRPPMESLFHLVAGDSPIRCVGVLLLNQCQCLGEWESINTFCSAGKVMKSPYRMDAGQMMYFCCILDGFQSKICMTMSSYSAPLMKSLAR